MQIYFIRQNFGHKIKKDIKKKVAFIVLPEEYN